MTRHRRRTLTRLSAAVACACLGAATACGGDTPATTHTTASTPVPPPPASASAPYAPQIEPAAFSATVDNPYFPLRPGTRWEYRARADDGVQTTTVQVTGRTRTVMGVPCVEVSDTVRLDGEVVEDTLDWYAQHRDGTVWYFGERTKEYDNGAVVTTKGSWEAGVDGARPGIAMPARPAVGDRYRQEYYEGEAEDMAEVLSVSEAARVPAGSYHGVLMTRDTTPLEPKALERKYYARGIGPVLTVDLAEGGARDELVRFTG